MRINQVAKLTGLTKKAIRYYEEKGLIKPLTDESNGYKIYLEQDIDELKMVSFLRNIGMPVATIKVYLSEPHQRGQLLQKFSQALTEKIEELRFAKELVTALAKENNIDYLKLNNNLILNQQKHQNFILKRLLMLFPNQFGKYLVMHFGAYLNEPLNTAVKLKAFQEMVEFLDSIELKLPAIFVKQINELDEDSLISTLKKNHEKIQELTAVNLDDNQEMSKLRLEIIKNIEIRNKINTETDGLYNKLRQDLESSLRAGGYYDKFIENLKIISKSYRDYTVRLNKLSEALGMSYDERGNVQLNK